MHINSISCYSCFIEEEGDRQAQLLMQHFVDENPGAEKYIPTFFFSDKH